VHGGLSATAIIVPASSSRLLFCPAMLKDRVSTSFPALFDLNSALLHFVSSQHHLYYRTTFAFSRPTARGPAILSRSRKISSHRCRQLYDSPFSSTSASYLIRATISLRAPAFQRPLFLPCVFRFFFHSWLARLGIGVIGDSCGLNLGISGILRLSLVMCTADFRVNRRRHSLCNMALHYCEMEKAEDLTRIL